MQNPEASESISIIFKATRKFNGLLQSEFAAILEVTQGTISKIEAGLLTPDLKIWFKFLKSFKITDPYCFNYSGLEYGQGSFDTLKTKGSLLASGFNFRNGAQVTTVKKIRPLFDYLIKHDNKNLEKFLKEKGVGIEIFYILNHPLTLDFVDSFFSYLAEEKMNAKSFLLMDLDFQNALGRQYEQLSLERGEKNFFELLNGTTSDITKYKASSGKNEYIVSVKKSEFSQLAKLENSDFILQYNLLYPYQVLKSLTSGTIAQPVVTELQDGSSWRVSYAS